ncbi:MAG: phosphoribosyl-ATP pyrophosphohydrolase [Acidimicrobiales bacterium]
MQNTLAELEATIVARKGASPEDSYSARLLHDTELLQRKIVEEAHEVTLELARPVIAKDRLAEECADLLYHVMVGLVTADVAFTDVLDVLEARR